MRKSFFSEANKEKKLQGKQQFFEVVTKEKERERERVKAKITRAARQSFCAKIGSRKMF